MKYNTNFVIYSVLALALLTAVGYSLSIEEVSITTLPNTMMCEHDFVADVYLCYQPEVTNVQ